MFKFIVTNWELVAAVVSLLASLVGGGVYLVIRLTALKRAKTQGEKDAIIAEIKSHAYGLVAAAEQMMSDIPKSGQVKLLYVLNHIQKLCEEQNVPYDCESWTEFINGIIGTSNDVVTAKETERAISGYINKVKEEIPYYMADADKLFEVIPDSASYKIEYILKLVANACAKHAIDVYDLYDWRAYINGLYAEQIGA